MTDKRDCGGQEAKHLATIWHAAVLEASSWSSFWKHARSRLASAGATGWPALVPAATSLSTRGAPLGSRESSLRP